jgi:predicted nuclease of restriction endonuclease-like (RecB) superfamily
MRQFYDTYGQNAKLSPVVREVSWTNNMIIIAQTKKIEEREFYLRLAATERYSKKELQRQLDSGLFERTMLSKENISPVAREIYPDIIALNKQFSKLKDWSFKMPNFSYCHPLSTEIHSV